MISYQASGPLQNGHNIALASHSTYQNGERDSDSDSETRDRESETDPIYEEGVDNDTEFDAFLNSNAMEEE